MAADVQRSPLLSCATEVLHDILTHVGTRDLASLSRTCRQLSQAIARDALLWKIHYLNRFVRVTYGGLDGPVLTSISGHSNYPADCRLAGSDEGADRVGDGDGVPWRTSKGLSTAPIRFFEICGPG